MLSISHALDFHFAAIFPLLYAEPYISYLQHIYSEATHPSSIQRRHDVFHIYFCDTLPTSSWPRIYSNLYKDGRSCMGIEALPTSTLSLAIDADWSIAIRLSHVLAPLRVMHHRHRYADSSELTVLWNARPSCSSSLQVGLHVCIHKLGRHIPSSRSHCRARARPLTSFEIGSGL
jgi:hypothetical protein